MNRNFLTRLVAPVWLLAGLWMATGLVPVQALADTSPRSFHAVMAEFRPLQFREGELFRGYAVDAVRELVTGAGRLDSTLTMEMMPWKRATVLSRRGPNRLFFSIARTPEREQQYHWIGEISPYVVGFVRLKQNVRFEADNIEELFGAKVTVGVQRASNASALLTRAGYVAGDDFVTYNHYRDGLRMLFARRIDAMPLTVMFYRNNACRQGLDGDMLETLFYVDALSRPLWLVASKETAAQTVDALRRNFRQMHVDGRVRAIQTSYLDSWNQQDCKAIAAP